MDKKLYYTIQYRLIVMRAFLSLAAVVNNFHSRFFRSVAETPTAAAIVRLKCFLPFKNLIAFNDDRTLSKARKANPLIFPFEFFGKFISTISPYDENNLRKSSSVALNDKLRMIKRDRLIFRDNLSGVTKHLF
ncbi:hypothetical protein DERP_004006 [Dermatophagoides pteronyssinus]|uniref:Uncharacterized protein n=1 Tax=Dermatophagoides pteronyssinus TaxID=6956 RepID=A0ABQ8J8D0_DERPT|nr:hypothetical protein DERP_004006 [Dermatophagoides pteronyssinus]